jgi:hypothetical protein
MSGFLGRLTGRGPRREPPGPPFTLDVPDDWAGGFGPVAYIEAMLNYGRAHPDCHDQVMIRLHYPADDDALYAAADACGPYASLMVNAEDLVSDLVRRRQSGRVRRGEPAVLRLQ